MKKEETRKRNKPVLIDTEIGKTYGFLTVVRASEPVYLGKIKGFSRRWLFKCICGNEKILSPINVINGSTKSCGCKRTAIIVENTKNYYDKKYATPVENRLYGNYAYHWNDSKREFSLSKEEFGILVNSPCAYCGEEPFLIRANKTRSKTKALNGIDRIDSSKGYILDNVVPCCVHCNRAKMDRSIEDFKMWVEKIYNHLYPGVKGRN